MHASREAAAAEHPGKGRAPYETRNGFPDAYASSAGRIARKAGADVFGKLVTLSIAVVAARTLTTADFGTLALATTTGWLLGVASDAGLSMHVAREAALHGAAAAGALRRLLLLRAAFGATGAGFGIVLAFAIAPLGARGAFALIVVGQLLAATGETVHHLFRGLERSDVEAAIHAGQRGATLALALLALVLAPGLGSLAVALSLPAALFLAIAMAAALRSLPATGAGPALTRRAFWREVAPLGAGALLSALYFRCDLYFVERWHGLDAVAGYNAAFRLVEALRLAPAAVLAVAFPRLVRAADLAPLSRLSAWLLAGGTLLLVATTAAAEPAIRWLYGAAYLDAAPLLRVLALSLPLFFLNYALTHQVIGWRGQPLFLAVTASALVANLGLNAWLVPRWAAAGAAWSTLLTELVVCFGCLLALRSVRSAEAGSPQEAHA